MGFPGIELDEFDADGVAVAVDGLVGEVLDVLEDVLVVGLVDWGVPEVEVLEEEPGVVVVVDVVLLAKGSHGTELGLVLGGTGVAVCAGGVAVCGVGDAV